MKVTSFGKSRGLQTEEEIEVSDFIYLHVGGQRFVIQHMHEENVLYISIDKGDNFGFRMRPIAGGIKVMLEEE